MLDEPQPRPRALHRALTDSTRRTLARSRRLVPGRLARSLAGCA